MKNLFLAISLSVSVCAAAQQSFVPDTLGAVQAVSHNPGELLRGEIAGVRVSSASGSPTAQISVDVRGLSTLRGDNQPLWIVDGAMIENASGTDLNPFWNYDATGKIQPVNTFFQFNAYDIESIEVLKDASATALYGSRGAAGVIIVKTRLNRSSERSIALRGNLSADGGLKNFSHNWYVNLGGHKSKTSYNLSATFRNSNLGTQGYRTDDFNFKANVESSAGKILWFGINAIAGMQKLDANGKLYDDYDDGAKQYAATASAWVRLNFGHFVNWTTTAGADYRGSNRNVWFGPGNQTGAYLRGLAGLVNSSSLSYNVRSEVKFNRFFNEKHNLAISAGVDFYGGLGDYMSLGASDYLSYELRAKGVRFSNSTRPPHVYADSYRHLGVFAHAAYSFRDIAGIDGVFRYEDGNFYPAGSAWFDIHNLAFRDFKAVSSLKLEGGYGISGNDKSLLCPFFDNVIDMTYEYGSGAGKATASGRSFQYLKEWHAGLRLGFIEDRIIVEGTYFDRDITDSFTQTDNGATIGSRSSRFTSRGVEGTLSVIPVRTENFTWTVHANAALIRTQVLELDGRDGFFNPGFTGSGFYAANIVGNDIGTIIGYKVDAEGKYVDVVPDGIIGRSDCVELGNLIPKVHGGVGTTLRYKDFTLDVHGDFAAGFSAIDGNAMKAENRRILTSRYVSKADFFRLSRVALNYDIPLRSKVVKGLAVSLSGHNLLTLTSFSGKNPESSVFGLTPLSRGIDYCGCPVLPALVLGAQIKF